MDEIVPTGLDGVDLGRVDVEAEDMQPALMQGVRERQADVAESDDSHLGLTAVYSCEKVGGDGIHGDGHWGSRKRQEAQCSAQDRRSTCRSRATVQPWTAIDGRFPASRDGCGRATGFS